MMRRDVEKVLRLADDVAGRTDPRMKWTWGQALLGYALAEADAMLGTDRYTPFLTAFCDHYVAHPPVIDCADRVAPALITYAMEKKTGNPAYAALTRRALRYIRSEPRLIGDAVNHLGRSPEARWYPRSVWVDSLMMFGVFPARYARENGDAELLAFAARQPVAYRRLLQDSRDKLWYHSYWVKAKRPHPGRGLYWGRGNGWVLCALPMILDSTGPEDPCFEETRQILRETAAAVLKQQNRDGSFNTLLGRRSYQEMSATALIAAGVLHGVGRGYLPPEHQEAGEGAFRCAADRLTTDKQGGLHMPGISAPTIPLHIFPGLCYRLTPRGQDLSYGIAALIFAAIACQRLEEGR